MIFPIYPLKNREIFCFSNDQNSQFFFYRYGSSGNPEFLIGWKSTFMTLATLSFICPLFMVMKKSIPYIVPSVLNIVTVVSVILVTATPLGFPYSANPNSLAPHR